MHFKQRLLKGNVLIGTFVKTPSPIVCEVLAQTKLDVLCLDAEHAPFDRLSIDTCLATTRLMDMPTLVRVPSATPEHLLNALDCGATGVVIPHVINAKDANNVARLCHFGQNGRGYAGSTRAADFGKKSIPDHLAHSAEETTVIAQIEDAEALDNIHEIARIDGIDCLFVGRIDLTISLGAKSPSDSTVVNAVKTICAVAKKHNRPVGMFVSNLDEVALWKDQGATLFLLSSDHTFLKTGANAMIKQVDSTDQR